MPEKILINEGDFGVKILFICHGNICRSAAAEVVLKQMAGEAGRRDLRIASAATTREEIGNDIYPPMKKALNSSGYACIPHAARQTVRADYAAWDYIIGMDDENMMDLKYIYGGDPDGRQDIFNQGCFGSFISFPGERTELLIRHGWSSSSHRVLF